MKLHRLSLLLILTLIACSKQVSVQPEIAPEVVLQRAVRAVQTLDSAQYVLQGDFDTASETLNAVGTVRMDGMLADGGQQLRFQMDLTADVDTLGGSSSLSGTVEVVVISEDEVYMNLHSLTSQPSTAFFRPEMIASLAGQWWNVSDGETPPIAKSVTPDPRLLHAQAQVVTITRDRGITTMNGREVHHYETILDKQKLTEYLSALTLEKEEEFDALSIADSIEGIEASGQLWIDAETYYVQKINWVVQSIPLENGGTASVAFNATFRNQNEAPAIVPPVDAKMFSPAIFFTLPSQALFPVEVKQQLPPDFDDEALIEIFQQLNSN